MKKTKYLLLVTVLFFITGALTSTKAQVKKLPPPVNQSNSSEKCPMISPDGKHLVFISNRRGQWDIFVSEKQKAKWSNPKVLESVSASFPKNRIIEGPSFNHDASRIYFSVYPWGKKDQSDIYYTERKNGEWGLPQLMPTPVNSTKYEGMPSITADNSTIYFVREKKNEDDRDLRDLECREIFYSSVNEKGEWSEPKKMANPINLKCESCPQVLPDNNTLIFSSVREPRLDKEGEPIEEPKGGFDLYYTRRLFKHIWSVPELMDVNSEQNDGYGSLDINQKQFLFSRTDEEGNSSIYQYNIQKKMIGQVLVLQGHIQDIYDDQPISANVDVIDPNTSQVISRYKADSKGNYYFPLNKGNTYLLDFYKENYSHHFKTIEVENLKTSKTDTLNVKLYDKVELLCNIYDTDIYEPINGEITVIEKSLGREIETPVERRDDGKYLIELPIGKEYKIKVNKEHYNPYDIQLDLTGIVQFNEFERDMEMEQKKKQVEIQVMDEETEEGMAVQLEIKNLDKNETIIRKAHVTEDGLYNIQLREGDKYEININSQKGYAFYNKKIDVGKGNRSSRMDIKLKPLKEETKLSLKNITFETNSAELDAESYEELNRVVDLLKANDNIKIEISAHTDDVGSAVYNQKLSQRRAQSVVEYLKDHDISENQMVSKGYGESKPLFPNNTEENRAKNRRVELEILEVKEEKIEANL